METVYRSRKFDHLLQKTSSTVNKTLRFVYLQFLKTEQKRLQLIAIGSTTEFSALARM